MVSNHALLGCSFKRFKMLLGAVSLIPPDSVFSSLLLGHIYGIFPHTLLFQCQNLPAASLQWVQDWGAQSLKVTGLVWHQRCFCQQPAHLADICPPKVREPRCTSETAAVGRTGLALQLQFPLGAAELCSCCCTGPGSCWFWCSVVQLLSQNVLMLSWKVLWPDQYFTCISVFLLYCNGKRV